MPGTAQEVLLKNVVSLEKVIEGYVTDVLIRAHKHKEGLTLQEIGDSIALHHERSIRVHTLAHVLTMMYRRDTITMKDVGGTVRYRLNLGQKGMVPFSGLDDDASRYCAIA